MSHARGGSHWPLIPAALGAALAFTVAFASAREEVVALDILRAAPPASLTAPREGPAIYRGNVYGPPGRKDADGRESAATWWWVTEPAGKRSSRTVCFERQIAGMRLRAGATELPITMFETAESLSLLGVDRDDDWTDPIFIDLATEPKSSSPTLPALAARCAGSKRTFISRSMRQGARAEVLACHRGGALVACDGPLGGVLAVDGMSGYRERRLERAIMPFVVASILVLVALAALLQRAIRFRERTFAPLWGGRP